MNISDIKKDFPIFTTNPDLIFLDSAATAQVPRQVTDVMNEYYHSFKANVHSGIYPIGVRAVEEYEKARHTVASFIDADQEEIVFTGGATTALNMISRMLAGGIKEGDEIVVTDLEHHSNFIPWQQLARVAGAHLRSIPIKQDGTISLDDVQDIITEKTKIVAVTHVSQTLGTYVPVKDICRMARKVGAYSVVDAAQSVPHMPVSVRDIDCDFLVISGHKVAGPTGVGVLYGKKEVLHSLEPVVFGGGMIRSVSVEESLWADIPAKFEAGTLPVAEALGLASAMDYLSGIGMDVIKKHENDITHYALSELKALSGVTLFGPGDADKQGGIISFLVSGVHPHDTAEILAKNGIAVRAGHHCAMPLMKKLDVSGTVRVSFYIYNTREDVDALIKGIKDVKHIFSKNV
ncbi:MAG: cysteine desulfurase [Candidatus Ryanbacteria bacterium CG10_big_fil_rev_8_21_14_0_10_43_42]|uniref:Cysteine desulfurase n=1 Tax=Candidatus Ryanbacteria bacterium CG10_big_fil_rev_8_21_14_0_10_43_42 TaxID=1974864 RepID=A0A2M8KWP2_9BACT|nr:MAG: cysteine desulfurase [Candidatus Ryanbacteria bacterium CG10_big_fil_rev_8_21_14_0_10_43_42]